MRYRGKSSAGIALAAAAAAVLATAATASAQTIDCSVPLTHNTTLSAATTFVNCGTSGLVIGADHVKLNLNGQGFDTLFGAAVSVTSHRYDVVENGDLFSQGTGLRATDADHLTIRNVNAGGDGFGISLTGGTHNRVLDSSTGLRFSTSSSSLLVSHERSDLLRGNSTDPTFGCQVSLDHATGTRFVRNSLGSLLLTSSNFSAISHNQIALATDPSRPSCTSAGGISGSGNLNLIAHNTVSGGSISLTGFGNLIFGNTVSP